MLLKLEPELKSRLGTIISSLSFSCSTVISLWLSRNRCRLLEKFISDPSVIATPELESEVYHAAGYVANLTLESLSEMFSSAQAIMGWLVIAAQLVSEEVIRLWTVIRND